MRQWYVATSAYMQSRSLLSDLLPHLVEVLEVAEDVLFSYNRQRTKEPAYVNASILEGILRLEAPDARVAPVGRRRAEASLLDTEGPR